MMSPSPVRLAILVGTLVVAAGLAGCVENVQDLKDAVTGAETLDTASTDATGTDAQAGLPPATSGVAAPKPPVARIGVFGADGAIVFKSSFAADETKVDTLLSGGDTVTFSAADSEAVGAGATLTSYAWTVASFSTGATSAPKAAADPHAGHRSALEGATADGGHEGHGGAGDSSGLATATGASLSHTFPTDGGVFLVTLTVTDSAGSTDAMALKVGVNPAPVTRSVTFKGTIQAGNGHNAPADAPVTTDTSTHVFNVTAAVGEMPAMPTLATLVLKATGPTGVDLDLDVVDPTGAAAGSSRGETSDESLELAMPKIGDWTALVSANLGVLADYYLVVDVTYQPTHPDVVAVFGNAASAGGDGHGHAH